MSLLDRITASMMSLFSKDTFKSHNNHNDKHISTTEVIFIAVFVIIYLILLIFVGKYLFNNILVKLVPGIKPVSSIWELIGLVVLLHLLFP